MSTSVAQLLRQAANRRPDDVVIVDLGADGAEARPWTARALDAAARSVAAHVRPGARVALVAENSGAFAAAWFGVVYGGATLVPIAVGAALPEIVLRLEHAGCDTLLCDGPRAAMAEHAATAANHPVRVLTLDAALAGDAPDTPPAGASANDAAMILYTSGTTASPKGAVISHGSLLLHTSVVAGKTLGLGPGDRILGALPLTHSYGCRMVLLAALYSGAQALLLPRFSARRTLDVMARYGVTWVPAVPTMFAAWAAVDGPTLPTLRWCLSAGAPLAADVRTRAEARLGAEIRQGYGMTEATFSTIDGPPAARTPGSVGRPVWGVEVRVVDPSGVDVARGEAGEIWLRGHNQMQGYLDDDEATSAAMSDGWMRSGDVGVISAGGTLRVIDRYKDLILRGGHSVYPSEIEEALSAHPCVAQVAVVGRPDPFWGEEIVAVVVAAAGASVDPAALAAFAAERVADYKLPRYVAVVAELPLGPSRKVLKRAIRAALADGTMLAQPV